jgi:hypothetical protein
MVDVDHVDNLFRLVDAVPDSVDAPASPPLTWEGRAKAAPHSAWVIGQRAEDELHARRSSGL